MPKHTASDLLDSLERHMAGRATVLREVTVTDAAAVADYQAAREEPYVEGLTPEERYELSRRLTQPLYRRIDALLVEARGKDGHYRRTAVEVKVSRADFRRDTEAKRAPWQRTTHRFYYLAPAGVIPLDQLPPGAGLWEYQAHEPGTVYQPIITVARRATINREPEELYDEAFTSYMVGRAARAEYDTRSDARYKTLLARSNDLSANLRRSERVLGDLVKAIADEYGTEVAERLRRHAILSSMGINA